MSTANRLALMRLEGAQAGSEVAAQLEILEIWPRIEEFDCDQEISALDAVLDARNPDERVLGSHLALLAAGHISIAEFPGIRRRRKTKPPT